MADEMTLDDLLQYLDDYEKSLEKRKHDKEHTYVLDIIRILHGRKWGIRKADLDSMVYEKRFADGEPMPREFGKTIQSVLNSYTSQSSVFQKAGRSQDDDLFYSPKGKGSGTWAVHSERAKAWVKRKIKQEL
jgi:7,8-dihydro-6-hydroxymethylpterin-pyrophosphokinase